MFGTCAQSCAVPLPTRLPVITCSPTAKNFFRNEDTPLTDYKEGHAQEAAESTQNLSYSGKDQFSSSVCMVWHPGRLCNSRSWFSFAVYQWIFTSCGLAFIFFLPLKLFSSPLIFVWSFCNVRLSYVSFNTPAAESYAKFHLFLMPLLFVILYAKLGVQNVPYFESSENNTHLSICICSVIISGHVSSVLVKLVIQQQHEPSVQTADQAVKTIPAAQLWCCIRKLWLCTLVQHTGTKPLLSVSGSELFKKK